MGDGGVACMVLQQEEKQKQNGVEKLENAAAVTEEVSCGGKSENGFGGELVTVNEKKKKKKVKVVKKIVKKVVKKKVKKGGNVKGELALGGVSSNGGVKSGEICGQVDDEVEEGELGTLTWPGSGLENGEFEFVKLPLPPQSNEIENGEFVSEKLLRNTEIEKGEFVSEKPSLQSNEIVSEKLVPPPPSPSPPPLRSNEVEDIVDERWKRRQAEKGKVDNWRKGEIVSDKGWKGENEKGAYGSWRGGVKGDDVEKGEFIPDRWHRGDTGKDDYGYNKINRYESYRDKGWKTERDREYDRDGWKTEYDHEYDCEGWQTERDREGWKTEHDREYDRECTSSSGRHASNDFYRKKEFNRSGSQHVKSAPRWENGQERNIRISSKIVDEERNEYDGRIHARDYSSGSRMKRHGNDSDGWERKQYGDYAGFKSRRLSDDGSRQVYSEHHSRHSVERSYRNSSSKLPVDKYSSRHHESSLPTRLDYDKRGCSPGFSERSPRDRARYYDNKDKDHAPRRSPYGRDRSPYSREKSPYDKRGCSLGHSERSPRDRARYYDNKDHDPRRSPYGRDRSPYSREKSPYDKRGCTPGHSERSLHDRARYYDNKDHTPARCSPYGRDRSPYSMEKSPYGRDRSPYSCEKSPYDNRGCSPGHSERSPHDRARYYDNKDHVPARRSPYDRDKSQYSREKSPYGRDRSPYSREKSLHDRERSPGDRNWDRSRHRDHKLRSPTHAEQSPQSRGRHYGCRDETPNLIEQSPLDQMRQIIDRETSIKTLSSEKRNSQYSCKNPENKNIQKEPNLSGERYVHDANGSVERGVCNEPEKEQKSCSPAANCKSSPCLQLPPEEQPFMEEDMEEDMDICDTPPHVHVVSDSSTGKWFYLDYFGVEHGPAKLSDIKVLVDDGVLMPDHFIKHIDSDRWLTVENAASPLPAQSFPLIVSDSITQLVNLPEAPGNILSDTGDILQSGPESTLSPDDSVLAPERLEDLHFDERVGVLLEGYDIIPGRELEAITGVFLCCDICVDFFNKIKNIFLYPCVQFFFFTAISYLSILIFLLSCRSFANEF